MHHQCKSVQSVSFVGNKPFPVRENVLHLSLCVAGRRILVLTVRISRVNKALGTCWRYSANTAVPEWQYVASRGQESPTTFNIVRVCTMR